TQAATAKAGTPSEVEFATDASASDGSHTVIIKGKVPAGGPPAFVPWGVPEPDRFAEVALVEVLRDRGVRAAVAPREDKPDWKALAASYTDEHRLAEHVSAPLTEEGKVVLKVSQNLHASQMPHALPVGAPAP